MKLRNKKTGDIWDFDGWFTMKASHETTERAGGGSGVLTCHADSLAELNEEWEDYKPSEPLIKDEKIRKAVRAWAKLNCSHELHQHNNYQLEDENNYMIEFADDCFTNLELGKNYTIAELCGEEEE